MESDNEINYEEHARVMRSLGVEPASQEDWEREKTSTDEANCGYPEACPQCGQEEYNPRCQYCNENRYLPQSDEAR